MSHKGQNLIFLISQPRSGSTLLQKILGSHPEIHTQSEPWILLHPMHLQRPDNLIAGYDTDLYHKAANDFISKLPGGEQTFKASLAKVYGSFYASVLKHNNKRLFLDKTPRYYHVIDELSEYFPQAKFVFLFRNPAAVLTSIVNTWSKENWYRLVEWRNDLLHAPELLLRGANTLGTRAYRVKYEDLLQNPDLHIEELCKFLGVEINKNIIQYHADNDNKWLLGDQKTVYNCSAPDPEKSCQWQQSLSNPQLWRVVKEYIEQLGERLISDMGYSYKSIMQIVHENKPMVDPEKYSVPFLPLLEDTRSCLIEKKRLQEKHTALNASIERLKKQFDETRLALHQKTSKLEALESKYIQLQEVAQMNKEETKKEQIKTEHAQTALKEKHKEAEALKKSLINKDDIILELRVFHKEQNEKILELNEKLNELNTLLSKKREHLEQKEQLINQITRSRPYRLGKMLLYPFRFSRRKA